MLSVLFGTVEYYERELAYYLSDTNSAMGDAVMKIFFMLEAELFNVFLCTHEGARVQCMHNLLKAFGKVSDKAFATAEQ
ncbi:hypothetical protein [Cytobacillus sp. NCCP-133]|uniref:hypothetical protein n=1 Tax=Cytobacillus sp. NCCP-133 TaxID=766848 RepID=UPI00223280AD|nr:hypothetical protein [Cytobacillus sp. NCCP-133]GLB59048.1 hypothetical protein NCCP133_11810 [Cytobacillus sp. NCCP-133]